MKKLNVPRNPKLMPCLLAVLPTAVMLFASCGGGSSTSPSQTASPPPAPVALVFDATWFVSPLGPGSPILNITLRFTGSMGGNIDQLRVSYNNDGADGNWGASWFVNMLGTNHVNAGQEVKFLATASAANIPNDPVYARMNLTDDDGEQWFLEWEP